MRQPAGFAAKRTPLRIWGVPIGHITDFGETRTGRVRLPYSLLKGLLLSTRWSGELMSINPTAVFSSWLTTKGNTTACGQASPTFQPAGGWFAAKPNAVLHYIEQNCHQSRSA
jgi:hypothetical protein